MSTFNETAKWLFVGIALAPMVIGIGWGIYEGSILPRLIPRAEIDALTDEIMRRYPDDPEDAAFNETYNAWHRSNSFEQGKWHRVRKEVRRRMKRTTAY
jgi:hypothetical protein